jgi:hypothetical protein
MNALPQPVSSSSSSFFPYGSGGYADYIFRYAAYHIFGYYVTDEDTVTLWQPVTGSNNLSSSASDSNAGTTKVRVSARIARQRQKDYYVATLYEITNTTTQEKSYTTNVATTIMEGYTVIPVLRFAAAYGMQTLQRALESFQTTKDTSTNLNGTTNNKKKLYPSYDYIEAMACPSGCINGGGQIRAATSSGLVSINGISNDRETPTETRNRIWMTQQYFEIPIHSKKDDNTMTTNPTESDESILSYHTHYHVVPPMHYSMGATAGVAVQDTQW